MSSETAANGVSKESGMTGITDPRDTDVLCGRGGAALRHPGNQTYRRLVNLNKGLYITCLKTEKLKISRSIVAAIREQNGRFLEKDAAKGDWYDIGDKKAIEKTSQALREGQPKLRQKIVEMGGGAAGTAALMEQQFGANGMYAATSGAAVAAQAQHAHAHQQHSLQQQNMRGFDHSNLAQHMGGGGGGGGGGGPPQMAGATMASMMNQQQQQQHPHGMAPAMRHHGNPQQFRQHHHHQQQRMNHHDMPPPQARQALHNEMMRLSMHGNDDEPLHGGGGGQTNNHNRGMGSSDPMPLRPSLVKRGSAAAAELGMQQTNMSIMSNFSAFGNSNHDNGQFGGGGGGSMFGMDNVASSSAAAAAAGGGKRGLGPSSHGHGDHYGQSNPYQSQDMDRRRIFAKMKYTRPPSDRMSGRHLGGTSAHSTGDGMPDFHMVESQLSLYSNLSGMTGNESKRAMMGAGGGIDGESKKPPGDLLGGAGSRHSIMSGLSRISDTSEVNTIFSDLSRKIGNVSTRSIAMSEISGIDAYRGGDDSDSTPSFGEADPRTAPSGTMDFDVF